jgi:hypothetical protein
MRLLNRRLDSFLMMMMQKRDACLNLSLRRGDLVLATEVTYCHPMADQMARVSKSLAAIVSMRAPSTREPVMGSEEASPAEVKYIKASSELT